MMTHSTRTTITPRTIQPVVDIMRVLLGGGERACDLPNGGTLFGRGHQEVGSRFHQKKRWYYRPKGQTTRQGKEKDPRPGEAWGRLPDGCRGEGGAARRLHPDNQDVALPFR